MYNSRKTAEKAAASMKLKYNFHYSPYKCLFCSGFHIGRNRDNKAPLKTDT